MGSVLVVLSLGALGGSTAQLLSHDYVAAIILASVGIALLRSGIELMQRRVAE